MVEAQVVTKSFVQKLSLTATTNESLEGDTSSNIKGETVHLMTGIEHAPFSWINALVPPVPRSKCKCSFHVAYCLLTIAPCNLLLRFTVAIGDGQLQTRNFTFNHCCDCTLLKNVRYALFTAYVRDQSDGTVVKGCCKCPSSSVEECVEGFFSRRKGRK